MGGDVACGGCPAEGSVGRVAVDVAGIDVVAAVGNVDVFANRVNGDAVGLRDPRLGAVSYEAVGHFLTAPDVDNGVGDGVLHRHIAPLVADNIDKIVVEPHVPYRDFEVGHNLARGNVVAVEPRADVVEVAARRYPNLPAVVGEDKPEIQTDIDGVDNAEFRYIDDAHCALIVRGHVTARIGHIEAAPADGNTVGLEADRNSSDDLHRRRVDLRHIAELLVVRVYDDRARIGGYIKIRAVESHKPAVGNVDLTYAAAGSGVHDLDFVRAVYQGI